MSTVTTTEGMGEPEDSEFFSLKELHRIIRRDENGMQDDFDLSTLRKENALRMAFKIGILHEFRLALMEDERFQDAEKREKFIEDVAPRILVSFGLGPGT